MSLLEVYSGRETWADYLRRQPWLPETPPPVALPAEEPELQAQALASGVAHLHADFTPLLGDAVWKLELQHAALLDVVQELRLAEFEREARAYRKRAETAYLNGWYEEALRDFLEAEKRHYPDYAVLRSIATIYLYHLHDLPRGVAAFSGAARRDDYQRRFDGRAADVSALQSLSRDEMGGRRLFGIAAIRVIAFQHSRQNH